MAAAAMMFAACTEDALQPEPIEVAKTPAVMGQTPVGFNAYTSKATTRGGVAGPMTSADLIDPGTLIGDQGFGVFAYYTDSKEYAGNTKPDFMYNQQVYYSAAASGFTYTPVKYWPNEYGTNAESIDQDKVSFFAYAPYLETTDAAQGKVADESYGITGFSRNSTAGDPLVKYIGTFDLTKQVDLTWGIVASGANTWATLTGSGSTMASSQTLTPGLPWLDVEHPANIDQKMKFNFRHALAQLNIQIDVDADLASHASNASADPAAETKVYVRSITLGGIVQKGALNLNNETPNQPRWMNYSGQGELAEGAAAVVLNDGRKNGKEGTTANGNEANCFLNAQIIQSSDVTTGVTGTLQNLFNVDALASAGATKAAQLEAPVYVIPNSEEAFTITIVYDVETEDANLSGYLSDGKTHGSSIQNTITKEIRSTGLAAGNNYRILLHLGLNSVKFDAQVTEWSTTATTSNAWLPSNTGEGVYNPKNPLTIISAGGVAVDNMTGPTATTYTINGLGSASALKLGAGDQAVWTINDSSVALLAAGTTDAADTRSTFSEAIDAIADNEWSESVTAQYIVVKPLKKGTATITSNKDGNISTIVITVDASEIVLSESSVSLYTFSTQPGFDLTATIKSSSNLDDDSWSATAEDNYEVTALYDTDGAAVADLATYTNYFSISQSKNVFTFTPVAGSAGASATVKLTTTQGATAEVTVKIVAPLITLNATEIMLRGGSNASQVELKATTVPALKDGYTLSFTRKTGTDSDYTIYEKTAGSGVFVIKGISTSDFNGDDDELTFQFTGYTDSSDAFANAKVSVQSEDPGLEIDVDNGAVALGRVLVSDVKKTYATVNEATIWGHSPIAIIAYVGDEENPADSYNFGTAEAEKYYTRLAMALNNAGNAIWDSRAVSGWSGDDDTLENNVTSSTSEYYWYKAINGYENTATLVSHTNHTHPAALLAVNYKSTVAAPSAGVLPNSGWFLPAIGQWRKMVEAIVGETALSTSTQVKYKYDAVNAKISDPGFTGFTATGYWSSSEGSATSAWAMHFDAGFAAGYGKSNSRPVRPVFAF